MTINANAIEAIRDAQSRNASIDIKIIASALNCDEKSCRRFLRSIIDRNDAKGAKWVIDAHAFDAIKARYDARSHRNARIIMIDDLK